MGTYLELTDTPGSYSGKGAQVVAVKGAEDGLEFVEAGAQGPQGPQGYIGEQGVIGEGVQGDQGPEGAQGEQGQQGWMGVQGPSGIGAGEQGYQGYQGPQGFQGNTGAQGAEGDQGNQGFQGIKGDQGDEGAQGSTGAQGLKGDQGDTGAQGSTGSQGVKGDEGDTGPQGSTGSQGPRGYQGYQGNTGSQGPRGYQGDQGYQGETGPNEFIDLIDTPAAYAGGAGKFVKVNATPDALEFANIALGDLPLPNTIANVLSDHSAHLVLGGTSTTAHRGDHGVTAYNHSSHNILALGATSVTAYRGDRGTTAYNHSQAAHLALGGTSATAHRGDHGVAAYNLRHAAAHALTTHSDFSTYLNQAVRTDSSPTHVNQTLSGTLTANGSENFKAYGAYVNTTASAANVRVMSSGFLKRQNSSIKFKEKVKDLELDSALLYNLRPVSFNSKCKDDDKNRRFIGLIAEEIEEQFPEIIEYNEKKKAEGYDSQMLITLMLAEIKKHEAKIKDLEARLNN